MNFVTFVIPAKAGIQGLGTRDHVPVLFEKLHSEERVHDERFSGKTRQAFGRTNRKPFPSCVLALFRMQRRTGVTGPGEFRRNDDRSGTRGGRHLDPDGGSRTERLELGGRRPHVRNEQFGRANGGPPVLGIHGSMDGQPHTGRLLHCLQRQLSSGDRGDPVVRENR